MLHSFGHHVQQCWTRACLQRWLCGYLFPWQWFTVKTCFVRSAWMLKYGMANEESFKSLSEESTKDLSANRKKKGQSNRWKPDNCKISALEIRNWKLLGIDNFLRSRGIVELLFGCSYFIEIFLFSPSLYPVSSLSSFCDSIILLFQHFKQSKSS